MQTLLATGLIGLSLGTQYALIAIGFTLIFGIMGVINFAHGGFYVLGGYFAYTLFVIRPAALRGGGAAGDARHRPSLGYLVEVLVVQATSRTIWRRCSSRWAST